MPANALAHKVARHGIGCVGQTTCIVVPELMSSTLVKPNTRYERFKM